MAVRQKTAKTTSTFKSNSTSNKKSSTTKSKKSSTRTPLKKRIQWGNLSPFPDNVLKRIFSFCLEEGREGWYTPQKTLVNSLRVNSVFFTIAGSVLYHSPTVMDLGTFISGSARRLPLDKFNFDFDPDLTKPDNAALARKSGCTKLVLLQYVKHLAILPCTAPRTPTDTEHSQLGVEEAYQSTQDNLEHLRKNAGYFKGQTYERAKTIIHEQYRHITPNCRTVTIGNDMDIHSSLKDVLERIQAQEDEKERVKTLKSVKNLIDKLHGHFEEAIGSLRLSLMSRFKPGEWYEYMNPDYKIPFKPEMSNAEYKSQYFPSKWMINTDLSDQFPLLWGSINQIIVRPGQNTPTIDDLIPPPRSKDIKRKRRHSWDSDNDSEEDEWEMNMTPPPPSDLIHGIASSTHRQQGDMMADLMGLDHENVQTILRSIVDSHPRTFSRSLLHADTKRELEDKTVFEIYGIENVIKLNNDVEGLGRPRRKEREKEVKSKFDYYTLEIYQSLQRQFKFKDRFWQNKEDESGPVVRFGMMRESRDG
ncbi:hypothetical protein I203_100234 [Kwoniella mangroviensis CBS 8507]|uniref:uncharacterized protein n=1 Tax=Kwoniella mangroviensis CBS 8507 TaxID=1296122 RepID=UPI003031D594